MFNQVLNSFLGHFGSSFLTKRQSASWFHEIGENNTDSGHSWVWSHLWILMVYWNKKSFRGPSVYKEGTNHWQKFRYIPIVSPIVVVCVHVCTWKFEVWLYQGQLVWHQEPKSLQVLGPGVFFFAPSKDKLHQFTASYSYCFLNSGIGGKLRGYDWDVADLQIAVLGCTSAIAPDFNDSLQILFRLFLWRWLLTESCKLWPLHTVALLQGR